MTINPNDPAFPYAFEDPPTLLPGGGVTSTIINRFPGLTKREWFAGMAMQGIIVNLSAECRPASVASDALLYANALIEALNKSNEL